VLLSVSSPTIADPEPNVIGIIAHKSFIVGALRMLNVLPAKAMQVIVKEVVRFPPGEIPPSAAVNAALPL
jgi:hypothetical protein